MFETTPTLSTFAERLLAQRVATRYLESGIEKHYRTDARPVSRRTPLPKEPQDDEDWLTAREYGLFQHTRVELVPMKLIKPERIWDERKIAPLRARMERGQPLDPIDLSYIKGRYHIVNGIHRYNLSQEFGFTHIPARVLYNIPFRVEGPKPSDQKVEVGTFVKLNEPDKGLDGVPREYGWVKEVFGPKRVSIQPVAEGDEGLEWPLDSNTLLFRVLESPPRWLVEKFNTHR